MAERAFLIGDLLTYETRPVSLSEAAEQAELR